MPARGFADISLLGGLGVEDQQIDLMPARQLRLSCHSRKTVPYSIRSTAIFVFMTVRGFAVIYLLGGLGVED
jgi:hypothetical protein